MRWISQEGTVQRIQCHLCGLIYYDREIPLKPVYDVEYNREFYRPGDMKKAGILAGTIADILKANFESPRILEVGPGNGLTAYLLKAQGFDISAIEIENSSADYISTTYDIFTFRGNFEDYPCGQNYDFIYAGHVIEHSEHPLLFFQKAWLALKQNGLFFFDTPDTHYIKTQGKDWKHCNTRNLYEHCSLFSMQTIEQVVKRIPFKIESMETLPTFQSIQVLLRKR